LRPQEFISRYRLEPLISSQEAKADTVLALNSVYRSPMQAFQAACSGNAVLTRPRLKKFIRGLGLRLHADVVDQLCQDVDLSSGTGGHAGEGWRGPTTGPRTVSFLEFLRLFRFDAAVFEDSGILPFSMGASSRRSSSLSAVSLSETDGGELSQLGEELSLADLEQALRERIRSEYGTMMAAFKIIDKDKNGTISRKELREALTTKPLDLGFDMRTIDAILDRADSDNNGVLDFPEFSKMFSYGVYQHERRKSFLLSRSPTSKDSMPSPTSSFSSERYFRSITVPLNPLALDRFWTLLQCTFADLSQAFLFLNGSDVLVTDKDTVLVNAKTGPKHGSVAAETLSQPSFKAGIVRLELLHRLRQVARIMSSCRQASPVSPGKGKRKRCPSPTEAKSHAVRSSWPASHGVGGLGGMHTGSRERPGGASLDAAPFVHPHLLAVLAGCPSSITMQERGKLLEVVCKLPHGDVHKVLQHAERARKLELKDSDQADWPEFDSQPDQARANDADAMLGEYPAAEEESLVGAQALSIFRHLDVDTRGCITEAALVRGVSAWLVSKVEKGVEDAGEAQAQAAAAQAGGQKPDADPSAAGKDGAGGLATVPEEDSSGQGAVFTGENEEEKEMGASVVDSRAASREAETSRVEMVRAVRGGAKMDRAVMEELAALRAEDVAMFEGKLKQVKEAHADALERIARAEKREGAAKKLEAEVREEQGRVQERERQVQASEKALAEHEIKVKALHAKALHKANALEDTARVLAQRKTAIEYREKLLAQQSAHVQQMQALVSRSYEQLNPPKVSPHTSEQAPATAKTASDAQGRRPLQAQQGLRKGVGAGSHGKGGQGREMELQALAVLLQSERDRYFSQLQAVERLVDDFEGLPNTPGPLLDALRRALYPEPGTCPS
jgi:hypothetical protein